MFSISFDLSQFERAAKDMQAAVDQVPFALANAMNKAAFETRRELVGETWPGHVTVRNKAFIGAALRVRKASKKALRISIFDRLQHADLDRLEKGGPKTARGSLAIPTGDAKARRSGKGVPQALRPLNLANSFKAPGKRGGSVIYQRTGKGKQRGLKLMYVLRPSAQIKPAVPFHADFQRTFTRQLEQAFPDAMWKAMRTRRGSR